MTNIIINANEGPAIIHYQPYIGDTWTGRVISFTEDGATLDVSGDEFLFHLEDQDGQTVGDDLILGAGIEFDGNGIVWTFDAAATATFTRNGDWIYSLKWTRTGSGSGEVKTIQAGNVTPRKYSRQ
jgi:hypothetical protein